MISHISSFYLFFRIFLFPSQLSMITSNDFQLCLACLTSINLGTIFEDRSSSTLPIYGCNAFGNLIERGV